MLVADVSVGVGRCLEVYAPAQAASDEENLAHDTPQPALTDCHPFLYIKLYPLPTNYRYSLL